MTAPKKHLGQNWLSIGGGHPLLARRARNESASRADLPQPQEELN